MNFYFQIVPEVLMHRLFGVEAQYLDASDCLDVLVVWCKNATEQKASL